MVSLLKSRGKRFPCRAGPGLGHHVGVSLAYSDFLCKKSPHAPLLLIFPKKLQLFGVPILTLKTAVFEPLSFFVPNYHLSKFGFLPQIYHSFTPLLALLMSELTALLAFIFSCISRYPYGFLKSLSI